MIRRPPRSTRTDTLVPYTTLFRSPRSVAIPGILVDAVVTVPQQMQTYRGNFDPSLVGYAGNYQRPLASSDPVKRIIARRAARELRDGTSPNFGRSEEHTSELQSLMRNSYAVFCLKKKTTKIYPHSRRTCIKP